MYLFTTSILASGRFKTTLFIGLAVFVGFLFVIQPEHASASYSYDSGCSGLTDGGDYYTENCHYEIRNNNGGGNINDTTAVTVSVPANADASRAYVVGVSANDTGYFTNADSHTSLSLSAYRCNGSGNTCTINYPVPNQRLPMDPGIGSFAVRINAIGPNGYARADIYFEFFKKPSGGVTPPPQPAAAPYFDYCAAPGPLAVDQATNIGFRVHDATSIVISSNTGGTFQGGGSSWTNSGLPADYSYILSYTPPNQYSVVTFSATGPGGSVSCSASVGYVAPAIYPSIAPTTVQSGGTVTYYWNTTNATGQVNISGLPYQTVRNNTWQSTTSALTAVGDNAITFSVNGPGGSASETVHVTVTAVPKPGSFTLYNAVASCAPLYDQPTVTLSWTGSSNATSYIVKQNGVNVGSTSGLSLAIAAKNATNYAYSVSATNASGTTNATPQPANAGTLTTPTCTATLTPVISPLSTTVAPGSTKDFTVQTALASTGVAAKIVTPSKLDWTLSDPTAGTISVPSKPGLKFKNATLSVSAAAALKTYQLTAAASYLLPSGRSVSGNGLANVQVAKSTIVGDVFSGGTVNGLTVDSNSVVSATGDITGVNSTNLKIPNYVPSNALNWNTARDAMTAEASKLLKEQVPANHVLSTGNFTLDSSKGFNLNPTNSTALTPYLNTVGTNSATNEGQVWYVKGDLTINGPVTFYGRGTILVDGNVTINGNVSYGPNASVGIIVRDTASNLKNIVISADVTNLVGAYYVGYGSIQFASKGASDSSLSATGIFVGNTIKLERNFANIQYDSGVGLRTPPGFGVLSIPSVKEANP